MKSTDIILLAEDNDDDVFFIERAWKNVQIQNPLKVVRNGQEAVDYLSGVGRFANRDEFPLPSILLLDLKMPFRNGHEVLEWIRTKSQVKGCIVIVLTSSAETVDVQLAYTLGANSYLVKPPAGPELIEMIRAFKAYWIGFNLSA
jgi:CheY-like chemotaxis protein